MRKELLLSGKQKTQDVREKSLLVPDSFEIEIDGICIGDNSQQEGNCIFLLLLLLLYGLGINITVFLQSLWHQNIFTLGSLISSFSGQCSRYGRY